MIERPLGQGWKITAWWQLTDDGRITSRHPAELVISLEDGASPATRARGISTAVMRQAESLVTAMSEQAAAQVKGVADPDEQARALALQLAAKMPPSPRVDSDRYYDGLVDAMDQLTAAGSERPVQVLAEALGISPHTVKTQLSTARRRPQRH
ncbi:hypothetical protein [Micromonospora sp. NPDC049891]|uniref:hypothetical protein n=1 Tax=Micromonospora sp. NPDC049891 TaxID=3155655 RepID=UPI0033C680C2